MARRDSSKKKFYTAIAFFAIVIAMTIWNLILAAQGGTMNTTLIFNLDFFGERTGEEQQQTTIITAVIITIGLIILLVIALRQRKDEEKQLTHEEEVLIADIEDVDAMTQAEFNEYFVTLFNKMGYKSEAVEGEKGCNVLLHRKSEGDDIVIALPLTREKIGNDMVDAVVAAREAHGATEGWIITNSKYADKTIKYAKSLKLRLVDRRILRSILDRGSRESQPVQDIMKI